MPKGKYIRTPEHRKKMVETLKKYCAEHPRLGIKNPWWKGGKTKVVCETCKKEFEKWPSAIYDSKYNYCSKKCYHLAKRLPPSVARRNEIIAEYRRHAKERNLPFLLTNTETEHLLESECFYCGGEPKMMGRKKRHYSQFLHNGIDRIDSTEGYLIGNVVPCCQKCNVMKWNFSKEEFLEHIERIYRCQH